jgi:hypothetical protein
VVTVSFIKRKKGKRDPDVCVEGKKSVFSILGNRKRC